MIPRPRRTLAFLCTLLLSGCGGHQLMPTPNLFVDSEVNPFAAVPEAFQTNTVDVLYVTDRTPEMDKNGNLGYGYGRSYSMAFGSAVVQFGDDDTDWDRIVEVSRSRKHSLPVSLKHVTEVNRFPETPYINVLDAEGKRVTEPATQAAHDRVVACFMQELRARLARTPRKEAYVYIHGYNNDFEYTVSVIAELWHFLGREGVPIVYTWPAGRGGLRGYFYDRESGEFTIYHLKQLCQILASCEELERVHVIAHSRGTDVTVTALRELYLVLQDELPPIDERKLANVVLAAPDLDIDVIAQRIVAEDFMNHIRRVTIYMSTTDMALGLSTWLFSSFGRIGRITSVNEFPDALKRRAGTAGKAAAHLVDARVKAGFLGHSYFYSHPAVSSDLILLLRDDREPGKENGRPLEKLGGIFWRINNDYPEQ